MNTKITNHIYYNAGSFSKRDISMGRPFWSGRHVFGLPTVVVHRLL